MTLPEKALRKLTKDELDNLSLEYRSKFNSTLANIDKDMGELRNDFKKLEADLVISRAVNTKLRDRIISLEHQCWSNSQYSRRECLEITGLPNNINNDPANILLDEDVLTSSSSEHVFKTSSRRLQDILKTYSRCLQDIFKTSCKDIFKTLSRSTIKLICST